MAERSAIEWCDSTFNPWVGCTKVSPACDHCYAEAMMSTRLGRVEWGAGKPRARTSVANWRKPLAWNAQPFVECMACAWRGEKRECIVVDGHPGFHPPVAKCAVCPKCMEPTIKQARRRVFCASLADVFDNDVDIDWRVDLLNLIYETPNIDWILLTKRVGNVTRMLETAAHRARVHSRFGLAEWLFAWLGGTPPAHVWLGATICNQAEADRDIPKLLAAQAAVRFLSIEPMLGPVDIVDIDEGGVGEETIPREYWTCVDDDDSPPALAINSLTGERWQRFGEWSEYGPKIHWVIAGGESGPHARPSHPDWFRSLRDQCAGAGVPFLFKQWGEWRPISEGKGDWYDSLYRSNCTARDGESQGAIDELYGRTCTVATTVIHVDGSTHDNLAPGAWLQGTKPMLTFKVGKRAAGRLLDGVEHNRFPAVTQ